MSLFNEGMSSAYNKLDKIWPPIENSLSEHCCSVFKMTEAKTMQKRIADNISPCLTPFLMAMLQVIPKSVLIEAHEPS